MFSGTNLKTLRTTETRKMRLDKIYVSYISYVYVYIYISINHEMWQELHLNKDQNAFTDSAVLSRV